MLTPLDLKLFRDLGRMKGQIVAVSLVMACGLAMMIMTRSIILTLERTRDAYYQRHRLADVFGSLKRAPKALADRMAAIPGVAAVETRVVVNATLDLEGIDEPATAHLVSLPEDGPQVLNQIFLRHGSLPRSDARNEAVVSEAFAEANKLRLGDALVAIINGRRDEIRICGIGLSPEFVFEARPGETLPDKKRYGVFWMNERSIAVPYNMDGAFNDFCLDLAPGVVAAPVMAELDRLLADYGAQGAYTRADHASAKRLDDELKVIRALSYAYPVVFLSVAAACGYGAYALTKKRPAESKDEAAAPEAAPAPAENRDLSWDDVEQVDVIGLEVGYRLIPLVDRNQGGELMTRIKGVRKKLSEELGFLVQAVHIRDNLELAPNSYRITLLGAPVGESEVFPERELAINPGGVTGTLPGAATKDPAFGMDAVWIDKQRREQAQAMGFTVVDASSVIATHLSHLLQTHAHELLGHEEVQQLLNRLAKSTPKLVEDLVPKLLPMSVVVKVLQNLLQERVPIRNLRSICETLAEQAGKTQDPAALVAAVRVALGRSIVQQISGLRQEMPVITLDPQLEQMLQDSMLNGAEGSPGFEPNLADRIHEAVADGARRQEAAGEPAVLLVAPKIRPWIARLMRHSVPTLAVLAYNEIPENRRVRVIAAVGR